MGVFDKLRGLFSKHKSSASPPGGPRPRPGPGKVGQRNILDRQRRQLESRRKQELEDEQRAFDILTTGRDPRRDAFDRESEKIARDMAARLEAETTWTEWFDLNSSNLDRTRYLMSERKVEIIYKNGDCYEYSQVESEIFQGLLQTHSPGQYRWYVFGDPRLGGGYYPYRKVSSGHSTNAAAPPRFNNLPFAIPSHIEAILQSKNRVPANTPTATGAAPPPPSYRGGKP